MSQKRPLRTIPGITGRKTPMNYFSIPKSACTTVKNILYMIDTGKEYDNPLAIHEDGEALLCSWSKDRGEYIDRIRKSKVTFTFVRHPGKRVFSCFLEKIYFEGSYSFPKYKTLLRDRYGYGETEDDDLESFREKFRAFLCLVNDTVSEGKPRRWDPHWAPQSLLVDEFEKYLPINAIGKVEKFQEDMTKIVHLAGVHTDVDLNSKYNSHPPSPFTFFDVLNDEISQMINSIYMEDFARFEYGNL